MLQLDIFKTNHYHNSLPERDEKKLEVLEEKAKRLEDVVLKVFEAAKHKDFTPADIYIALGQQYPLTSVRRAITNLTKWEKLYITINRRPGMYGADNNCWKLKQ